MEVKQIDAKERTARVYPSKQTTRKFYSPFPNHLWCIDLIDLRNYPTENKHFKYISYLHRRIQSLRMDAATENKISRRRNS